MTKETGKGPDFGPRHFDGPILLPYQAAWNQETAKLAVDEKSRRIGLSWGEASEDALLAAQTAASGGMDVWYISYNKEMTKQFISDVAMWAKVYNLAASDVREEEIVIEENNEKKAFTAYSVSFDSGHTVTGLPSHPRVLRSKQGKVVIDEAAFVDNLEEIMKAAMAMLVWGGCVRVISTHNGEDNPFNQLVQDIRAGKYPGAVVHRTTFDDALEAGLFKRICAKKDVEWSLDGEEAFRKEIYDLYGDNAAEELDCIPAKGSGTYLTRNLIESCMVQDVPVFRWSPPAPDFVDWDLWVAEAEALDWCEENLEPVLAGLPKDLRSFVGEDFGRSGDLTVIWPLIQQRNLDLETPFVIELRNAPHRTQQTILFYVLDRLPRFSGAALDARGNGEALAEFTRQKYGKRLAEEVKLSEAWYRENMPKMKSQFEDRTLKAPKDDLILDDLRAFKMVKGVARLVDARTSDDTGQRHGDAGIALAMAVFAAKSMEYGPIAMAGVDPEDPVRMRDMASRGPGDSGQDQTEASGPIIRRSLGRVVRRMFRAP